MKAFIITILIGVATALDVVPGSYIIQLKPGTSASAHHRAVRSLLRKLDSTIQSFSIGKDFNAYAATALSTEDAAALSGRDDVLFVEPDFYISVRRRHGNPHLASGVRGPRPIWLQRRHRRHRI